MWRARSDGDDRPSRNGDIPSENGSRAGQDRTAAGLPGAPPSAEDPRSELTGRKIRRIEAGPPGTGSDRKNRGASRNGPALAGRRPVGADDQPDSSRRSRERGGRHIGRSGPEPDRNGLGFEADAGGGLPPLRPPTGEVPEVPAAAASAPDADQTELGWPSDPPSVGVFGDGAAAPGPDGVDLDSAIPSALGAAGGSGRTRPDGDDLGSLRRPGNGSSAAGADPTVGMPSAFPGVEDRAAAEAYPSWSAARSDETAAIGGAARAAAGTRADRSPATARTDARPGIGRPDDRRPIDAGPAAAGRPAGRAANAHRLQETEIKLAGRKEAPVKPREPNRLLLGLALLLVVAAGAAVAWWLTRDDGTTAEANQTDTETAAVTDTTVATETTEPVPESPVAEEPILDVPMLSLVGVDGGPLDAATTYSIDLVGEAPGSMLQVVVDSVPQGEPAAVLPDLILPPGRHTLSVNVTNGAELTTSTPVSVYVLDQVPPAGHIANLASIDILNEGWDEAIRRFDGYRDAGHEGLQLLPITPGYWNIFVGGLGDAATVTAYCESFGLAVPDDCFPRPFDPAEYQGPSAAPAGAADAGDTADTGDGSMTDDDGSMTEDDGSMTDEGEAETSTSTTTGG